MKFLAPAWLWVLLALPVIGLLFARDERRRLAQFERFAARALWRALVPELDPRARLRKAIVWLLAAGFVILALARPQWGSHEETIKATGLDIMVALDVSNSMEVEDVVPSRIKKARHLIKSLTERLKGDRVGIVAFAASSYVACPLTTDTDYVNDILEILGPRMVATQGTDVGIGLDTARKALDRGAEESVNPGSAPAEATQQASHVIVLISDGEDQEEGALSAARALKDAGIKLYVLGIGTEKGGPVPVRDAAGNLMTYKKDRRGESVVSSFKPDALMQVATAAGGRYWNVTSAEGEVDEMLADMGALNRTDYSERRYLVYEERFQVPLAIAVLLVLLELGMPVRRTRKEPDAAGAGSAAPRAAGGARVVGLMIAALGLLSEPAHAESFLDKQTPIDAYLENEKGVKAFKDGKADEAERKFGTAQALNPELPELQFNQGVIQMEKGDAESASRAFSEAAEGAMQRGDATLQGKSLYNLGGALSKKGDVPNAARSYMGAIESALKSGDKQLEEDARRNLQLLIQEKQKQKQQSQNGKDQKDQKQDQKDQKQGDKNQSGQNQKDSKDPKDQKDQGDEKKEDKQDKKDEQGKQPKQYEDPKVGRSRQFKSPKLSKDDAEKVMAELSNREKDLQARIKKQNGTPQQRQNEKDW